VTDHYDVFLSYSHGDEEAATSLRGQLEKRGLAVFWDKAVIREGDLWLNRLQEAVDACCSFVVLVGRDGVRRWIGAETQVALSRHFGPHDDAARLPIFPVLLGDTKPETLPAFLRLFQGTFWNGADDLSGSLLDQIRERASVPGKIPLEDRPFVGLNAYQPDQAHLFFGRQKETLDALACFDTRSGGQTVRWLEINGNSGCGKSSLMNAGILPLVDQGWLWPRTRIETWRRSGPMMPGERPTEMLAQVLANAFGCEMADVHERLSKNEDGLRMWLRSRQQDDTAFLLAVDQFEELFTFADPAERARLDHLLAAALADAECPLFVISTVRADFLDRFDDLPRLTNVRNRAGKPWTLPLISADGLREVISGPARLAGLDVSEVQAAMVAEAQDEPGGLPLVENALEWLWQHRADNRLSGRLFVEQGGLAGILSRNADDLLPAPGPQRDRALELLFRLVKVDPEGRRHTRQRMPLPEAIAVAGGGKDGEGLVYRLAGQQVRVGGKARGSLRLVTITGDAQGGTAAKDGSRWLSLIHETLIRSKGRAGELQPYWPTLWDHIEQNKGRAVARDRARLLAVEIEDAAVKWHGGTRVEGLRWSEERFQEVIREVRRSGFSPGDVVRSELSRAFFGPARLDEIVELLALGEGEDKTAGSGRYGETWRLPLSHQARATLGDRLALLGDTRRGVGVREDGLPDIDWCRIDGGAITITIRAVPYGVLSQVGAPEKSDTREVKSFSMARYPVTVDQFRAFVEACYNDDRWNLPGLFSEHLAGPPRHVGRHGNHPADGVSWYDAMAFCHWMSARMDAEVRLPTEFEWQLAATGGDPENTYPWGAEWHPKREPWRANTLDIMPGRSTAVGLYPLGASKAGLLDMAGTIWEWCWNTFEDPVRTEIDRGLKHQPRRALRGGSWQDNRVRCADRIGSDPDNSDPDLGFRVLCSSLDIDS
jgi:formylglycine-generating enzyme required for sulfatase activity